MIGSLRGRVLDRDPGGELLVEVSGVGYRVVAAISTIDRVRVGEDVLLYVHHHIRETDQKLYGFLAKEERAAFEGLLAAHGVGPALALAVLATHPAGRLARILADDDLDALCEVPGVGKKTAQRLLVELRSTLVLPDAGPVIDLNGDVDAVADVREALLNLGYSTEEIRTALAAVPTNGDMDSGQLLKRALRVLAGG